MKYAEFLRKIKFSNPEKNDVILFHQYNSGILQKVLLDGIDHTILPADREEFYLTPQILFYFIKNIILNFPAFLKYGSKYQMYVLSCMDYIKPKIVITFVHNCFLFQSISRIYSKAEFYAIQNGIMNESSVTDTLPKPPMKWGTTISMPNFICFGKYEADLYSKYGHRIDRYYPLGSLIGGYYKTRVAVQESPIEFDICLVSQWRRSVMMGSESLEFKKAFNVLDNYLSEYVKERNYSLCIARFLNDQGEKDYFHELYGDRVRLIEYDRLNMSTYAAMDRSRLIVTCCSCAALEAFGWGKKVLFCNFTDNRKYDFPVEGLWFLSKNDYKEFKNKLDYLFAMKKEDYLRATKNTSRYVMNYDFSMPVHTYVKNIITKAVKQR